MADFESIPINGTAEQLEKLLNMDIAESISEDSTNDEIPTAGAVFDFLNGQSAIGSVSYLPQELEYGQKEQARKNIDAATIDNTTVGIDAWSSKNIVDKLCPSFTESGSVVACEPVEGYPLEVVSSVKVSNPNLIPVDLSVKSNWIDEGGGSFIYETPYIPAGTYTIFAITDYNGIEVDAYNEATGSWDYLAYVMDDAPETFTHTGGVLRLAEGGGAVSSGNVGVVKLEAGTQYTGTNYTTPTITRCGKNIMRQTATSQTINGVTFTANGDGSVTVNGTCTATTQVIVGNATFKKGLSYVLTGCPAGGGGNSYRLFSYVNLITPKYDDGRGVELVTQEVEYTSNIRIFLAKGVELDNVVFYPMIRLKSVEDATYEPYKGDLFAIGENVPALPGVNTLWADTGDITVQGKSDPVAIIGKLSATVAALTGV